jgi:hypothetical protein
MLYGCFRPEAGIESNKTRLQGVTQRLPLTDIQPPLSRTGLARPRQRGRSDAYHLQDECRR